MTTTKAKPVVGGAYVNVALDTVGRVQTTDTTLSALAPGSMLQAMQAANQWHNCAGAGSHGTAAQATANGAGVLLEDV